MKPTRHIPNDESDDEMARVASSLHLPEEPSVENDVTTDDNASLRTSTPARILCRVSPSGRTPQGLRSVSMRASLVSRRFIHASFLFFHIPRS